MYNYDKTIKLHALPEDAMQESPPQGIDDSKAGEELAIINKQLEVEKKVALENLKVILQLRENLKQEQIKSAQFERTLSEQTTRLREQQSHIGALESQLATLEFKRKNLLEALESISDLAAAE
jgi:hypothetical protein